MTFTPTGHNSSLATALDEAREKYTQKRPRSQQLHQQALEVLPGGNTRTVLSYAPFPTAMASGEGAYLRDVDGHDYLDLCGEYTAGLFGHTEQRIHQALHQAMARGIILAAVGEAEQELAQILCARFPSFDKIRFTNSGTEANLIALSIARVATGRTDIIAFRGGYHGSLLYFPVSGSSPITAPFPVRLCDYNDMEGTIAAIRAAGDKLAAIIVEPMLGSGGCIPAQKEFLTAIAKAARETGALLIFDEVMTSRMSGGGMQQRLHIRPDLTTLGKYIGGGMSFGAFGGTREIMDLFASKVSHAGTFNNNVMTMAAGITAMRDIFTAQAADTLYEKGENLRHTLNQICRNAAIPLQFAGLGSLATPHFRTGDITTAYPSDAREEALKELFFFDMLNAGIYIARRGMTALSLPVTDQDLARFTNAVEEFVASRAALMH